MRCLRPLPMTVSDVARAEIGAFEPKRFGNAQAAAIEQAEHRGVAGMDPRLAAVAGGNVGIGHAPGRADGERPRQRFTDFRRTHRGERADLALAALFEKAAEGAQPRKRAHQRAAADIVCPPRRQKGAHVGGRERGQFLQRRRAAEMAGEEVQELQHVALVSFERLRRQVALGAEVAEPVLDFGRYLGRDEADFDHFLLVSAAARS